MGRLQRGKIAAGQKEQDREIRGAGFGRARRLSVVAMWRVRTPGARNVEPLRDERSTYRVAPYRGAKAARKGYRNFR
jgi:hypothetical protein